MTDIHVVLTKLAYLLQTKPNMSELKENENLLRKLLPKHIPAELYRHYAHKLDSVELLLLIQAVSRGRVFDETLVVLLASFLAHALPYSTRNAIRHLIAQIACTIHPSDLISWVGKYIAASVDQIAVWMEVPLLNRVHPDWVDPLFSFAVKSGNSKLIENWIVHAKAQTVIDSGILACTGSSLLTEEILVHCCRMEGLADMVIPLIHKCTEKELATRLIGEVAPWLDSAQVDIFTEYLKSLVINIPDYEHGITLLNNVLLFMESVVHKPVILWELALLVSAYPVSFDRILYAQVSELFLEIRSACRGVYRSWVKDCNRFQIHQMLRTALTHPDWRIQESTVHAISSLSKSYIEAGSLVVEYIANHNDTSIRDGVDRAIKCSIVMCMSGYLYLSTIEWHCMVLNTLANIDTVDYDYGGWFDFRSKQDNVSVVYFDTLLRSRKSMDNFDVFLDSLLTYLPLIKQRLYYRDPFRQSRDLFINAIVGIITQQNPCDTRIHSQLFPLMCEDCFDMYTYVSAAPMSRELLLPIFKSTIEESISRNAPGSVQLVACYTNYIDTVSLCALFQLSRSSLHFSIDQWLAVGEPICDIHGEAFINLLAESCGETMCDFPRYWFQKALPKLPNESIRWLNRIFHHDIDFKLCNEYAESMMMVHNSQELAIRYTKWLCAQSLRVTSQPVLETMKRMDPNILSTCLRTDTNAKEIDVLLVALQNSEHAKARRILKKLA